MKKNEDQSNNEDVCLCILLTNQSVIVTWGGFNISSSVQKDSAKGFAATLDSSCSWYADHYIQLTKSHINLIIMEDDFRRFCIIKCVFDELIFPIFKKLLKTRFSLEGFESLEEFLNSPRVVHVLFHLRHKNVKCCIDSEHCKNNSNLPLYYEDWDYLYSLKSDTEHNCHCNFKANKVTLENIHFHLCGLILEKCAETTKTVVRDIRQFFFNYLQYNTKYRISEDEFKTVWIDLTTFVLSLDSSKDNELVSIQTRNFDYIVPQKIVKKIYKMTSVPRGETLIINIKKVKDQPERLGAQRDQDRLVEMFKSLGYNIKTHQDKTAEEIAAIVRTFAQSVSLCNIDSVIVVLMSHGTNDFLDGCDGKKINVNLLINFFNKDGCPTMVGKPKMFIINACRSDISSCCPVRIGSTTPVSDATFKSDGPLDSFLPMMSDLVIAYSTFQGYESYRDENEGSYFIQCLAKVLEELSSREHVMNMLTEVNYRVAKMCRQDPGHTQIPAPVTTLRKKWYLNPPQL